MYRAIKLNMHLCRWERVLEVAQRQGRLVDAVLLRRRRHLAAAGTRETLPAFIQADTGGAIDEPAAKAAVAAERAGEPGRVTQV